MYVLSNKLWLPDVFENFQNMCPKTYELDPARFPIASGLTWQKAFKKTKVKLDLLTEIDMLLVAEEVLEEEYVTQGNNIHERLW